MEFHSVKTTIEFCLTNLGCLNRRCVVHDCRRSQDDISKYTYADVENHIISLFGRNYIRHAKDSRADKVARTMYNVIAGTDVLTVFMTFSSRWGP